MMYPDAANIVRGAVIAMKKNKKNYNTSREFIITKFVILPGSIYFLPELLKLSNF